LQEVGGVVSYLVLSCKGESYRVIADGGLSALSFSYDESEGAERDFGLNLDIGLEGGEGANTVSHASF
jgi:hypothetical protein